MWMILCMSNSSIVSLAASVVFYLAALFYTSNHYSREMQVTFFLGTASVSALLVHTICMNRE